MRSIVLALCCRSERSQAMLRHTASRFSLSAIQMAGCLLSCMALWHAATAFGRTPLAEQIHAEAHYVAATGYMERSVAEARKAALRKDLGKKGMI